MDLSSITLKDFVEAVADAIASRLDAQPVPAQPVAAEQDPKPGAAPTTASEPVPAEPKATRKAPAVPALAGTTEAVLAACNEVRARLIGDDWEERKQCGDAYYKTIDGHIRAALVEVAKKFGAASPLRLTERARPGFIAELDRIGFDATGTAVVYTPADPQNLQP